MPCIHLADRARRLRPELTATAREVNALATAGLSDSDREVFLRLIRHAIVTLEG
ncbi:hypothetical protein [Nocardia rhizosphaerihabitans]|uniref:MarR family transcriptional regulator n=1 Tax=Nocardia rhizosphaerihabitans TaxID=1691570 RepID=A0ABQ2KW30_9NOCA|nr:hypothetical protein [Nocardia rhizosphaerihabitans]GGN94605.1 hypothetical protein GCM10011610_57740 [Nocardia rhizosphaerihabitans]